MLQILKSKERPMKTIDLRISQVENGFVVTVTGGSDACFNLSHQYQYVFNSWEAAAGFISSLNDKFK